MTHVLIDGEETRVYSAYDPEGMVCGLGDRALVLDLFCGVGGAARTLGDWVPFRGEPFDVLGIDVDASKVDKYPDYFIEYDLTEGLPEIVYELADRHLIDVIWASPPCQFATNVQFRRSGENLIPLARELMAELPEVPVKIIENVEGAGDHLRNPVRMCGSAFGLGVKKHRLFETNFFAMSGQCDHPDKFDFCIGDRETPVEEYRAAHGFPRGCNLTTKELREAIPPAYVRSLLDQYLKYAPHPDQHNPIHEVDV